MEKFNKMTRSFDILNQIKNTLLNKECCNKADSDQEVAANYEYECRKCGLVLDFNRNQTYVKCPNDGSTMYRTM
jgi:hypothetical protein